MLAMIRHPVAGKIMRTTRGRVEVVIFDDKGKNLTDARVAIEAHGNSARKKHVLRYDEGLRCYAASDVPPGDYLLTAEASPRYASDRRKIRIRSTGLRTIMVLGASGLPYIYRGAVKTPFQPQRDLFAVVLARDDSPVAVERVLKIAEKHNLTPDTLGDRLRHHGIHLLRFASGTNERTRKRVITELLGIRGVKTAGSLVHVDNEGISILTNELIVRFQDRVTGKEIGRITRQFKLKKLRKLIVADRLFLFRVAGSVPDETLHMLTSLTENPLVAYAEPNLISTGYGDATTPAAAFDTITPSDLLFPMQWHLAKIRCPEAWKLIHETSPDHAMGSPETVIAVVDWGIDVRNPDFAGKVSNGKSKVVQSFDFHHMTVRNRARSHGHGTCCAGLATALPNNGGGCGAAGNCRLMAIRRPEGIMASETAYSDMYLWIGGFDPRSTTPGFPKRVRRGADVISSSFGHAAGMPISGLMNDTFDFLTSHGRDDRGTLLFFSTGNSYPQEFTLSRPWAAHERTFAVTASTLANDGICEIRARESNCGSAAAVIDFCAPTASYLGAPYDPPRSYAIVTTADRMSSDQDRNLQPNAPSRPNARSALATAVERGAAKFKLAGDPGFAIGQFVVIGLGEDIRAEFNRIKAVADHAVELEEPLKNDHGRGASIVAGAAWSLHTFSGTSCATALAAGVGALLLSADPELTFEQARDFLRESARKIDISNTDLAGIWRDASGIAFGAPGYAGPSYSRWYGFGRLDAFAAIEAALRRRKSKARRNLRNAVRTVAPETHDADNPHRNS
jgi:subtilisin family serine protease